MTTQTHIMKTKTNSVVATGNTKAISIRQPWAWLIVRGEKDIENRTWRTNFRGRVFVHAAQKIDWKAVKELGIKKEWWPVFERLSGGIVGEVEIVDCVTSHRSVWFEGPFGFVLKNARPLEFLKMHGKLGFFDVTYQHPKT